jgi:hypothetical protein
MEQGKQQVFCITVFDEDGEPADVRLPARFEVCSRCQGHGKHDHPAFANGITSDEWNSPDWDDESRETYMRGGYDVRCEACRGERVVLTADEEAMTEEQRALWVAHVEASCAEAQEREAELRYGY